MALGPDFTSNSVWGWACWVCSVGYYVVPRVAMNPLAIFKTGLLFFTSSEMPQFMVLGVMDGISHGRVKSLGIWPIMLLLLLSLVLTLIEFFKTIAEN